MYPGKFGELGQDLDFGEGEGEGGLAVGGGDGDGFLRMKYSIIDRIKIMQTPIEIGTRLLVNILRFLEGVKGYLCILF
jgi:hypothetical protein